MNDPKPNREVRDVRVNFAHVSHFHATTAVD